MSIKKRLVMIAILSSAIIGLKCKGQQDEMVQKSISALPANQKNGVPEVTAADPVNGATSVSRSISIALAFGTKVNIFSVESGFSLKKISNGISVSGAFTWNQGTSLVFTPSAILEYNTEYRVSLNGQTILGQALVPYTSTFRTANDGTVPTVNSSAPANGVAAGPIVVSVAWSEPMNTALVEANCMYDGAPCILANLSWSGNTMNYSTTVACGQTHTLTLNSVEDATGTAASYAKTFTTVSCCTNVYPDCCVGSVSVCNSCCWEETGCCGCACVFPPCGACHPAGCASNDCGKCGSSMQCL